MSDDSLSRFLGGKPTTVVLKLVIISVIVGALLHWAGLSPLSLVRGLQAMIKGLIGTGWDAVSNIAEFALYGAMVVVPIWLIARALSTRNKGA
ncbi:MAG: DUF6460 domain-containing protein [Beijerinckiaceae bacterium]